MLAAITTGVTTVIGYVGNIIKAITGTASAEGGGIDGAWGSLLPVIGLGIGVMFVVFAITTVKSLIKGY
jgi:hypothetical protein